MPIFILEMKINSNVYKYSFKEKYSSKCLLLRGKTCGVKNV